MDKFVSAYTGAQIDDAIGRAVTGGYIDSILQRISNRNLLHNWYFADPINQRGQTEYVVSAYTIYTIDRWKAQANGAGSSITMGSNGIAQNCGAGGTYTNFVQPILPTLIGGGEYTFSILADDAAKISQMFMIADGVYAAGKAVGIDGNLYWKTFLVPEKPVSSCSVGVQRVQEDNGIITYNAAKLELGSVQTLAHQDADGNWVLNDPPPDKATELLKCQRYYQIFATQSLRPTDKDDFRPPMRITPTLGTITIDGKTYYTADANL